MDNEHLFPQRLAFSWGVSYMHYLNNDKGKGYVFHLLLAMHPKGKFAKYGKASCTKTLTAITSPKASKLEKN